MSHMQDFMQNHLADAAFHVVVFWSFLVKIVLQNPEERFLFGTERFKERRDFCFDVRNQQVLIPSCSQFSELAPECRIASPDGGDAALFQKAFPYGLTDSFVEIFGHDFPEFLELLRNLETCSSGEHRTQDIFFAEYRDSCQEGITSRLSCRAASLFPGGGQCVECFPAAAVL